MREIIKPALVLLAICAGVTLILALVFNGTKPIIADRAAQDLEAAKKEVLPLADKFVTLEAAQVAQAAQGTEAIQTVKEVYAGFKGTEFVGSVYRLNSRGYDAAGVEMTVGFAKNGSLTGVKIGENKETPGLGTKVLFGDYMKQYKNLKPQGEITVVKNKPAGGKPEDIDAVTGATISSRAVARGVEGARQFSLKLTPEGGLK